MLATDYEITKLNVELTNLGDSTELWHPFNYSSSNSFKKTKLL